MDLLGSPAKTPDDDQRSATKRGSNFRLDTEVGGDGRRRQEMTANDAVELSGCLAPTPDDGRSCVTKRDSYFRFDTEVVGDGRRRYETTADDAMELSGCLATTPTMSDAPLRNATATSGLTRKWSAMVGDDRNRLPAKQYTCPAAQQRARR